MFRDLPEEFDEAATVRGAENLFRRNRHRACKRQFSNLISFRSKWLRRPWPRRWLINPGKGGTANSFMSWRKWLYAVEPGTYCPTFSNKNWMCFAKSLTVASDEIPFSSQERSFLLQNLQWWSHNPFRNRTRRDGKNSTSVFPSRPQLSTRCGSISGRSPRSSRRHIAVEASALRSGRFTVRTLQREESTILPF